MSKPVPTYLSIKNAHPRDPYITFDEGPHIYTVHGEGGYTSVTTWNHHHFSLFDADSVIQGILKNRRYKTDPEYKYYGRSAEDIKAEWDRNRDQASGAGTNMHYDIECYYNQMEVKNDSVEYQYFRKFLHDFPTFNHTPPLPDGTIVPATLVPYRTEWMIYYEELRLSGSVDMVFENPEDGTIQIYDWKRCKEIKYENEYGKTALTASIKHLPDTNFWHYALQLNTYKTILEEKYGKKVTGLYLVCLHPDNPYKTYDRIEVPFLEKEMKELFEERRKEIEMKNA
jgi:PD-(D/E)XK nuclease superfamily